MTKKYKILLISSSTGGHAIPVYELYKELKKDSSICLKIFHTGSEAERELFSDSISFIVSSGKINRHQPEKNISEFFKIIYALFKSLYIIITFRPNIVFSKGGFNAVPLLFWARLLNIPYFIHESDSEMGLSNKSFYKSSVRAFVSFPVSCYNLDKEKLDYSGMIIRDFEQAVTNSTEKPIILVTGGSQGARAINECVIKILPTLLDKYIVAHQIGANDIEMVEEKIKILSSDQAKSYHYFVFSKDEMEKYLLSADLIISRSGSTIGEIARLHKASILIPYPYAASDHQTKNAKYLEKIGGAIIIRQDMLSPDNLLERISFILSDKRNLEVMGLNAEKAIKTDGKEYIVKALKKYLGEIK